MIKNTLKRTKKQILSFTILFILISSCSKDTNEQTNPSDTVNKVVNRQTTGSSSNDLLSDDVFTNIVIELVYVEGFEPTQSAIDNFVTFLNTRTFKPNGITIQKRSIPSPGNETYTIEEVADIERNERTLYNTDDEITVWALFIDGKSDRDTETNVVLGTAYWNTSFVIYEETVHNLSDGRFEPDRSVLESTVINHEFGHILGLTNLGSPMQTEHEDLEHPKHCNVESCLMYWESEVSVGRFNMSSIPQLDSQCIADLRANGGK